MGLIDGMFTVLFGNGANMVKDTAEVFRVNAEASEARATATQQAVMQQFASEFTQRDKGLFDRVIDGLNRLPRPALALGTIGLFVSAMVAPIWFAERMQGITLVPEPLWWLFGAIISFYFGARHQVKGQEFQRSLAETMARVPVMAGNLRALQSVAEPPVLQRALTLPSAQPAGRYETGPNRALDDWRAGA
ncbi:holin family protein [Actibacterium sp. D379-3]